MKRALVFLLMINFFALHSSAQTYRVATYNIRMDAKSDAEQGDGWQQRHPVLTKLIQFHDFDIFGCQEVLDNQLQDMTAALTEYGYTGVGRDDGKTAGEYSPIFYKKDKFKLIDSGTFWLSEDTKKPNKGWDAVLPRICSWGEFEDLHTGKKFMFFNTHFDHVGVKARAESAKLIMKKTQELGKGLPAILTGDFNVDQRNESYHLINDSDLMDDAYELAPLKYAFNGTFSGFKSNVATSSRIDHIFLTRQFKVLRYGILTDSYRVENLDAKAFSAPAAPKELKVKESPARLPSDHYPVMAVVELSEN